MTRVNLIPPSEISPKQIRAEWRELKRIPNLVLSGAIRTGAVTEDFVLGTGHMRFFTDKLKWLYRRYHLVLEYCRSQGWKMDNMWPEHATNQFIEMGLWNDWVPSAAEIQMSRERIALRLAESIERGSLTHKKVVSTKRGLRCSENYELSCLKKR